MDGGLGEREEYTVAFWRKSHFLSLVLRKRIDRWISSRMTGWMDGGMVG